MHKVHHSDWQPETNSNYSTVLSLWDRLFVSFRMRSDLKTLIFGIKEFTAPAWQSWWGMWVTPFLVPQAKPPERDLTDTAQVKKGVPENEVAATRPEP
jgi:hypothetical protein